MKNFSEFKANLTFEQKDVLAITFSIFFTVIIDCLLVFFVQDNLIPPIFLIFLCIVTMLLSHFFLYSIFYILFSLSEKEAKKLVSSKFDLTKTEYIEVDYDCVKATENTSTINFLLIVHTKHYFYAKLNDKEEIVLLIKNSKQDVLYNSTVSFSYFYRNFNNIN